ncbi:MAG: hypothetical protein ABI607_10890 [Betaproteobacteria bacterium]
MSNLPDEPEHDPQLATAWREHSTDMPPAHLDAAILAAARRAVGSAPQDAARRSREATRPQRWWMPLAAAATIGAVALGILQTGPLDEPASAPTVSDMPAAPAPAREQIARENTVRDNSAELERKEPRSVAPEHGVASVAAPRATERQDVPAAAPRAAEPAARSSAAPARQAAKVSAATITDGIAPPPPAMPAAPMAPISPPPAMPAAPMATISPLPTLPAAPQPFPADKKRDAKDPVTSKLSADTAPARSIAERDDLRTRSNEVARPGAPATAAGAVTVAKSALRQEATSAKAIDIDASITRIRKLHDEGKLAEAAKELVALRAIVPDADQRLPPELRPWAATVRP